jgi:hypothetical protein
MLWSWYVYVRTCPGPIIVPFQSVIMMSSPLSNPYEHEPSPMPFSPFSSSSSKRKFRGTVRELVRNQKSMIARYRLMSTLGHRVRKESVSRISLPRTCAFITLPVTVTSSAPQLRSPLPPTSTSVYITPCGTGLHCHLSAASTFFFLTDKTMFRGGQTNAYDDIVGETASTACHARLQLHTELRSL